MDWYIGEDGKRRNRYGETHPVDTLKILGGLVRDKKVDEPIKEVIQNQWDALPSQVREPISSAGATVGTAIEDTLDKSRKGLLGPSAFAGSWLLEGINKTTDWATNREGLNLTDITRMSPSTTKFIADAAVTRKLSKVPKINFKYTKRVPKNRRIEPGIEKVKVEVIDDAFNVPSAKVQEVQKLISDNPGIPVSEALRIVDNNFLSNLPGSSLIKGFKNYVDSAAFLFGGGVGTGTGVPSSSFSGGVQGELFPGGPIDPAGKEAYRIYTESLARRSGYDTFKMMKKEIFDKWPQKDQDQAFRQLWQGTQTNYVGYSEHLTAKASKKLRRDKLVAKYPNETPAQIDVRLAKKSKSTFDMDWYWDKDWIDAKGVRRTDGLNRGDRNAPDNMQLLFNDRLKSIKDVLENVGYGSEDSPGILWGTPTIRDKNGNIIKAGEFRDPDKRFLIKFETPQKRSVKKAYLRQNPGDAVIYRASNGKIVGNIGQYLDVLYPKKYKHPQTGEIINPELELMEKGVSDEINPTTGKLFTGVEEFREFILTERLGIILRDTNTLPSNPTARKRYIKERIDQDMVDLREKYPWLPKPPSVIKEVESNLTTEDYDLRTTSNIRNTTDTRNTTEKPKEKSKPKNYKQTILDIFGKDR